MATSRGDPLSADPGDGSLSFLAELRRRMERMFVLLLALALGLFAFDRFALAPRREAALVAATTETAEAEAGAGKQAAISEKAIAVLPFVNMSADRDNEYFSDGISEEILNALAQVKDLKVAGRTSSFQFKGRNESLTSIGQALGVANVLEGSVRKQGDKVRITAQRLPPRRGGAHRTCAGDRSDGAQRDALARRALPARWQHRRRRAIPQAGQGDRPAAGGSRTWRNRPLAWRHGFGATHLERLLGPVARANGAGRAKGAGHRHVRR